MKLMAHRARTYIQKFSFVRPGKIEFRGGTDLPSSRNSFCKDPVPVRSNIRWVSGGGGSCPPLPNSVLFGCPGGGPPAPSNSLRWFRGEGPEPFFPPSNLADIFHMRNVQLTWDLVIMFLWSMRPWWHHSVENDRGNVSKWWKIFRAKMVKSGVEIFFTRGL